MKKNLVEEVASYNKLKEDLHQKKKVFYQLIKQSKKHCHSMMKSNLILKLLHKKMHLIKKRLKP